MYQIFPFTLTAEFKSLKRVIMIKKHYGQSSKTVEYRVEIDPGRQRIVGSFANGTITLSKIKDCYL